MNHPIHSVLDMNNPIVQLPVTFFTGVAVILHGVLIIIILLRSEKVLGAYKNLLLVYTCIGFMSSLSLVVTLPIVMPTSRGLLFYNTVQRVSKSLTTAAIYTFSVCYVMWALILTYSFIYRCLAVRNKEKLLFNRNGWILMILFAFLTAEGFLFICWNFGPSTDTLNTLANRVYNVTGRDIHSLSFVGGEFFNHDGSFGNGFWHCITHVGFVLICCITMGICTYNFYTWYRKKMTKGVGSDATRIQQKKLFLLLILQTVTPLVFSFAPALAVTALTFYSIDVTDFVNYVLSFMLTITQMMDPIWIFLFITDYRNSLFCRYKKSSREAVYATEPSITRCNSK